MREEKAYFHDSFNEQIKRRNHNVPIYKFIPIDYVISMILNKEIFLSQVSSWEDVYENFLAKAKFTMQGIPGTINYNGFLAGYYGQCWTLQTESDAFWRIYSPNKRSVRVKTTLKKLAEISLLEKNYAQFSTDSRIVGPIKYMSYKQMFTWATKAIKQNENILPDRNLFRESLFLKRKEFLHEKEVRLIMFKYDKEDASIRKTHLQLPIEPNEFIEEIVLDPRLHKTECANITALFKKIGFKNSISQSRLYTFKQMEFQIR